jgi:L-2-hydroxyglutarate oxidase LhgO
MQRPDFLVIGGGIVGLSIARSLKSKYQGCSVLVLEKETKCGMHASGRNSGVLHAGFYYTADSLKARFTRDGNEELTRYCKNKGIYLNTCGKLVVAQNENEDRMLDELISRARANDVSLEEVTLEEARKIEPRAKTYQRALFSPTTSSADPTQVISNIADDAIKEGVEVQTASGFLARKRGRVVTTNGTVSAGYIVNAAGLYADKISKQFGFGRNYAVLPFKGLYLKSSEPPGSYRTHIYPVPDLDYPFLGVHFTVKADGSAGIGPTAIPAFWREQYSGVSNFNFNEFLDITGRSLGLMVSSTFDFKKLAVSEFRKYSRSHLVNLAMQLVTGVQKSSFVKWTEPGIRAQLIDNRTGKLEMDFVLEGDDRSMHVLNAVSPGWTCSFPFSRYVVNEIDRKLHH